MSVFSTVKLARLRTLVRERVPKTFAEVRDFLAGDHYQFGKGFVGPAVRGAIGMSERDQRASQDVHLAALVNGGIERAFTPEDLLTEIRDRRTDVVLAKEPQWTLEFEDEADDPDDQGETPAAGAPAPDAPAPNDPAPDAPPTDAPAATGAPDDAGALDDDPREPERRQIAAALANRWDVLSLHDTLKGLADTITAHGRAVVQIVVPPGLLAERTRPTDGGDVTERYLPVRPGGEGTAEEALDAIHVDVWAPDRTAEVVDPETRGVAVILHVESGKHAITGLSVPESAVVSYVRTHGDNSVPLDEPLTALRTVTRADDVEAAFELGGLPLMREARERRPFITPPLLALQRALNTASTEMRLVNDKTGFQRHVLLNAMPPTITVTRRNPTTGGDEEVQINVPFDMGPGDFAVVQGTEREHAEAVDDEGIPLLAGRESPSVVTLPPGDPAALKLEMGERREAMLRRSRQLYALLTGDADVSGESRIAALFDLLNDAGSLKSAVDAEGKWLLETMWAVACWLAGTPERRLDKIGLKVVFDCRLTMPQPTAAQITGYIALAEKQIWAPETAMAATGIDDTDAEEDRIRRARERRQSPLVTAQTEAVRAGAEVTRALAVRQGSEATSTAIEDAAAGGA